MSENKIWHTGQERPDGGEKILLKTQERMFACSFACRYLGNFEIFYADSSDDSIPVEDVIKLAYIKDLEAMQ